MHLTYVEARRFISTLFAWTKVCEEENEKF